MKLSRHEDAISLSLRDGKTPVVYLFLASRPSKSAGLREIQKALEFSSPSSALYHLVKLEEAGLVEKNGSGNYSVKTFVKFGILKDYLFVRGNLIPRDLAYSLGSTILALIYLVFLRSLLTVPIVLLAILPSLIAAGIFWYEALLVWRSKPRFR